MRKLLGFIYLNRSEKYISNTIEITNKFEIHLNNQGVQVEGVAVRNMTFII